MHAAMQLSVFWALAFVSLCTALVLLNLFYNLIGDGLELLSLGKEAMIAGVQPVCPIDPSPLIEGREAENGIIRPNLDPRSRPQWPESFFLIQTKTRLSYTLEAPSDFTLATRANALVAAARTALALISES